MDGANKGRSNGGPSCPNLSPKRIAEAKQRLAESIAANPPGPITPDDILKALDDGQPEYFITTNLHWDCECNEDFQRPQVMEICRQCGRSQEEQPGSRINELRHRGIHLGLEDPAVIRTLEGHGPRAGAKTTGAEAPGQPA